MSNGSTQLNNRSHFRTKSIGVRVTEADFARLQTLADGERKSLGEWCRDVLLGRAESRNESPADQALLSELLALRTILLNMLFSLAKGKALTDDEMEELIERADAEKFRKALERLEQTGEEKL